jgi:tRNA threonylcarbamoyladenosine biosynthesis protein TsaE
MKLASLKDTKKIAKKFSKIIKNDDVIFLHGEVGAGKTTFARFFINNLEEQNKIKKSDILSPTFNIVYDYNIKNIKILHYDLYRLKNYNDILELGIFESSEKNIKIIEWPELIKPKPKNRIEIIFKYSKSKNNRDIRVKGFGKWEDYKFNEI